MVFQTSTGLLESGDVSIDTTERTNRVSVMLCCCTTQSLLLNVQNVQFGSRRIFVIVDRCIDLFSCKMLYFVLICFCPSDLLLILFIHFLLIYFFRLVRSEIE